MELEEAHDRFGLINSNGVRDGLYLGLGLVVISLLVWFVDPLFIYKQFAASLVIGIGSLVVVCLFMVQIRRLLGNFWSFGEAFRAAMIIALISTAVYHLWLVLLYNVLDRTLGDRALQVIMDNVAASMEKFGQGAAADAAIEKMKQTDSNPGHMLPAIKNFLVNIGMWAIGAVIIAAIFQRKKPVFQA